MPRIKAEEFLNKVAKRDFKAIRLKGLQGGHFCLMLEDPEGVFTLENKDGSMKEYPRAEHALRWIKRVTGVNEVIVDIELWRDDIVP